MAYTQISQLDRPEQIKKVIIFIDSNVIIKSNFNIPHRIYKLIPGLTQFIDVKVCIPSIIIEEVEHKYRIKKKELKRSLAQYSRIFPNFNSKAIHNVIEEINEEKFLSRIHFPWVEIINCTLKEYKMGISRVINEFPPSEKKDECIDSILWTTFLNYCSTNSTPEKCFILITNDKDFYVGKNNNDINKLLQKELNEIESSTCVIRDSVEIIDFLQQRLQNEIANKEEHQKYMGFLQNIEETEFYNLNKLKDILLYLDDYEGYFIDSYCIDNVEKVNRSFSTPRSDENGNYIIPISEEYVISISADGSSVLQNNREVFIERSAEIFLEADVSVDIELTVDLKGKKILEVEISDPEVYKYELTSINEGYVNS